MEPKEITYEAFMNALAAYGGPTHCELFENYRYGPWENEKYYLMAGCAVQYSITDSADGKRNITCNYHQISPACDAAAVMAYFRTRIREDSEEHEMEHCFQILCLTGEKPEYVPPNYGWQKYTRMGEACPVSPDIKLIPPPGPLMSDEDWMPLLQNDTRFGKIEAAAFAEFPASDTWRNGYIKVLGCFRNGAPAGFVSYSYNEKLDLAWLRDIYVLPAYRKQGVGKALLRAALSAHPDKNWLYQVSIYNEDSVTLAKSMGFTFYGSDYYIN